VVDDEPPARQRLRSLLAKEPDIDVVAECANGPEAVVCLQEEMPDLVLLDVQMPEMDGFEVLHAIDPDKTPAIIFATAYDEHALRAFDVHAVDYLLKPIDAQRFSQAIERARERLHGSSAAHRAALQRLLAEVAPARAYLERLAVREMSRIALLPVTEIDWIEAADNYVRVHSGGTSCLMRMSLKELERRLDPDRFARVHRSALVAIDRIRHLEPWSHGDFRIILHDGTRITASRSYAHNLRRIIGEPL
jgi:two-component system LytT family response regulator